MTTRLYTNVFGILSADLAELEGGAHLAVELVLLLGHPHVVLRCGLDSPGEVGSAQVWPGEARRAQERPREAR